MKKLLSAILAASVMFISAFTFTGCTVYEDLTGISQLKNEITKLKEDKAALEQELVNVRFEAEFPKGLVDESCELNTVEIHRTEVNTEGSVYAVRADGADVVVTINGGEYDAGSGSLFNIAVWAHNGSKVVINNGVFITGDDVDGNYNHCIYAAGDSIIEINGGWFESTGDCSWLLNCQDNHGTIIVKGGTFVNFDPSNCVSEGANTNFVAEGYIVESEVIDAGLETEYTIYKVVKAAL